MIAKTIYILWKHRIGKASSVRVAIKRYNKAVAGIGVQAFLNGGLPDLVVNKDTALRQCSLRFGHLFPSLFKSTWQLCVRISMQNTRSCSVIRVRDVERRRTSLGERSKEEKCERNNFKVAALKRYFLFFISLFFFFNI